MSERASDYNLVSEGTHDKGIGYTALSTSIIVSFLLFALCFQWLGLLGFPDSTQHLFSGLSPDDRQWLGMSNFNPYLLIADFIVLQLAIFLLHARINQIYAARAAAAPVTVKLQIESTTDRELRHSSQPYTSSDSGTSISLRRSRSFDASQSLTLLQPTPTWPQTCRILLQIRSPTMITRSRPMRSSMVMPNVPRSRQIPAI